MTVRQQIFADLVRDGMRRAFEAAAIVEREFPGWNVSAQLVDCNSNALGSTVIDEADFSDLPYISLQAFRDDDDVELDPDEHYPDSLLVANRTARQMAKVLSENIREFCARKGIEQPVRPTHRRFDWPSSN